jgi:hypothetical protein
MLHARANRRRVVIVTTQNTELAQGAPRRFLDLLAAAS